MGAMTVMMAPRPSCAARDLDWSAGDGWAKAVPPLWQYLVVCVKADESIFAPFGRAAPHAVTPANQALLGSRNGCHDRDDGTPAVAALPAIWTGASVTGGRGLCPAWQYLSRLRPSPSLPSKGAS